MLDIKHIVIEENFKGFEMLCFDSLIRASIFSVSLLLIIIPIKLLIFFRIFVCVLKSVICFLRSNFFG